MGREVGSLARVHEAGEAGDVAYLITALAGTHLTARWLAAKRLGKLRAEEAYEPLLRCASNAADETLRGICLTALGEIGNPKALDPVWAIANEKNPFAVRTTAMKALVQLGDRRGIELLAAVVVDPDLGGTYAVPSARPPIKVSAAKRWAAKQVIRLGGVEAIPLLTEALADARGRDKFRIWLLLGRLRHSRGRSMP